MPKPNFQHSNDTIQTFVKTILNNEIPNRAQYIIMSGIALNNADLIKYACEVDPLCAQKAVKNSVLQVIDAIFGDETGKTFYNAPCNEECPNTENNLSPG